MSGMLFDRFGRCKIKKRPTKTQAIAPCIFLVIFGVSSMNNKIKNQYWWKICVSYPASGFNLATRGFWVPSYSHKSRNTSLDRKREKSLSNEIFCSKFLRGDCHSFDGTDWTVSHPLTESRIIAASLQISPFQEKSEKLLLSGGFNGQVRSSLEVLTRWRNNKS